MELEKFEMRLIYILLTVGIVVGIGVVLGLIRIAEWIIHGA